MDGNGGNQMKKRRTMTGFCAISKRLFYPQVNALNLMDDKSIVDSIACFLLAM